MAALHKRQMRSFLENYGKVSVGWGIYQGHGYDGSGSRYVIRLGDYKLYLDRDDTEQLIKELRELLDNPEYRE